MQPHMSQRVLWSIDFAHTLIEIYFVIPYMSLTFLRYPISLLLSFFSSETSSSSSTNLSPSLFLFSLTKMGRSPCCDKVGLKKGPWTPEEDQKLLAYIEEHGHGSWRALPSKAGDYPHSILHGDGFSEFSLLMTGFCDLVGCCVQGFRDVARVAD